jgi:hypothetical protein
VFVVISLFWSLFVDGVQGKSFQLLIFFLIILCLNYNNFLHNGIEGGHELKAIIMVLMLFVVNLPTSIYIYYKLYVYMFLCYSLKFKECMYNKSLSHEWLYL